VTFPAGGLKKTTFYTKFSSKSGVSAKANLHLWTGTRFIYPAVDIQQLGWHTEIPLCCSKLKYLGP
jgi:hypothetical protein